MIDFSKEDEITESIRKTKRVKIRFGFYWELQITGFYKYSQFNNYRHPIIRCIGSYLGLHVKIFIGFWKFKVIIYDFSQYYDLNPVFHIRFYEEDVHTIFDNEIDKIKEYYKQRKQIYDYQYAKFLDFYRGV
jgi:hypothetical protein